MAKPEDDLNDLANSAGLTVAPVDAQPCVLIPGRDGGDLNAVARKLGELIVGIDLFSLNGELIYFGWEGDRKVMEAKVFRTWIMDYVVTARRFNAEGELVAATLNVGDCSTILSSENFLRGVRKVTAINRVRLPVVRDSKEGELELGRLEMLPWGYDDEAQIYTVPGGLEYAADLDLSVAKGWLSKYLNSFPFANDRSSAVQISALLALYVKQLLPDGCLRPGYLWLANKPASGKSVLAKAGLYPVLEHAAAAKMKKGEEQDKELEAFARSAAPYLFIDNVYGGINSAAIDQLLTSEETTGRSMGGHGIFTAKNTMLLFVTGNRLELNEDAQRRFLVVDLFEKGEPIDRVIEHPLNDGVMKSDAWRKRCLECLWAIVSEWHRRGMPQGKIVSPTFEDYSKLMGGLVTSVGYADPMEPAVIPDAIGPEKAEFVELMREVLASMAAENVQTMDFTLEDLARLARVAGVFDAQVGDVKHGEKLTIKEDKLSGDERSFAVDNGYLTPSNRSAWGKRLKREVGGEKSVDGKLLEFGKRAQARKATFTITIVG